MKKTLATLVLSLTATTTVFAGKKLVTEVNEKKFPEFTSGDVVAVQFYAQWDDGRSQYSAEFEKFCASHPEVLCGQVNVDKNVDLSKSQNALIGTPKTVFYRSSAELGRVSGVASQADLDKRLDDLY